LSFDTRDTFGDGGGLYDFLLLELGEGIFLLLTLPDLFLSAIKMDLSIEVLCDSKTK
jgi:hypothetical protein